MSVFVIMEVTDIHWHIFNGIFNNFIQEFQNKIVVEIKFIFYVGD